MINIFGVKVMLCMCKLYLRCSVLLWQPALPLSSETQTVINVFLLTFSPGFFVFLLPFLFYLALSVSCQPVESRK